ncbi:MAG: hypothetical protein V3T98_00340 [Candidatus Paceibacterota bacterium]
MSDKFCRFYNICGTASEGCRDDEECDLRIHLEKCIIVKGQEFEECDIPNWKLLVPKGYACCSSDQKCSLRETPELRILIEKYGVDTMNPQKLDMQQKNEIIETIKKFSPKSTSFLKIEV